MFVDLAVADFRESETPGLVAEVAEVAEVARGLGDDDSREIVVGFSVGFRDNKKALRSSDEVFGDVSMSISNRGASAGIL